METTEDVKKIGQSEADEQEIINSMQNENYPPKEIADSMAESNVIPASPQYLNQNYGNNEMQPSMMPKQEYAPQQQEEYAPEQYQPEQYQEGYPQQAYSQYLPSTSDTMTEIAEEIVEEKLRKIEAEISNLTEFKTNLNSQMKNLAERLKRIESIIDALQLSILKKVSMYGENLLDIKSELEKTQESFSKILNPAIDKARKQAESEKHGQGKRKPAMDHYLRR